MFTGVVAEFESNIWGEQFRRLEEGGERAVFIQKFWFLLCKIN